MGPTCMLNIIYKIAYSWFHPIRTDMTNECIRWYLLSMILLLLLRALMLQLWLICALSLASSQNLSYLDIYQELFVTHFIWYIHCSYQKARTDSERFILGGNQICPKFVVTAIILIRWNWISINLRDTY